jgi:nicotinamide riboside transporter PnuC
MIDSWMWLVTAASLVGTLANVRRRRWCFYVWLATNACWAAYNLHKGAYAQAVLMATYFGLSIWGLLTWRRGNS